MKKEIYEDVLKEEPDMKSKEYGKWAKRLSNSIGWITPMKMGEVFAIEDKNGKLKPCGDVMDSGKIGWDVELEEGSFTCDKQVEAELLSYIVQMNERIKRIEKKMEAQNETRDKNK